jgi:hypothetical protein
MQDFTLAYELVRRLNHLVTDPEVGFFVTKLINEGKVNVTPKVADHPTIQVNALSDGQDDYYQMGFLGLLNGMVGIQPSGTEQYGGWGYVCLVDNRWFSVLASPVSVDDVAGDPGAHKERMLRATGTVTALRGFGKVQIIQLSGETHTMSCICSKPGLGDEFPEAVLGEELELYGHIEPREGGHVFQVLKRYPGRDEE